MKKIRVGNNVVEIYSSIEELPIKRYQKFNKFLMIDNEVGSNFNDYEIRTSKAIEFLRKDLKQEAIQELENRRQMVFNAFEEYSPKSYALAVLVKRINDEVYTSFADDTLREIIDKLDEIEFSKAKLDEEVSEVKKK